MIASRGNRQTVDGKTMPISEVEEYNPYNVFAEDESRRSSGIDKKLEDKEQSGKHAFLGNYVTNSIEDVDRELLRVLNRRGGGLFGGSFKDANNNVVLFENIYNRFRTKANIVSNLVKGEGEDEGKVFNRNTRKEVLPGGKFANGTDIDNLSQEIYIALNYANKIINPMQRIGSILIGNTSVGEVRDYIIKNVSNINQMLGDLDAAFANNKTRLQELLNKQSELKDGSNIVREARTGEEINEIAERQQIMQAEYYLKNLIFNTKESVLKSGFLEVVSNYLKNNFKKRASVYDTGRSLKLQELSRQRKQLVDSGVSEDDNRIKDIDKQIKTTSGEMTGMYKPESVTENENSLNALKNLQKQLEDSLDPESSKQMTKEEIKKTKEFLATVTSRIETLENELKTNDRESFEVEEYQYADKYDKVVSPFDRELERDVGEISDEFEAIYGHQVPNRIEEGEETESWKEFSQPKNFKGNFYFEDLTGKAKIGSLEDIYNDSDYQLPAYYRMKAYGENPLVIDANGQNINAIDSSMIPEDVLAELNETYGHMLAYNLDDISIAATKAGYDSTNIRDASGIPGESIDYNVGAESGSERTSLDPNIEGGYKVTRPRLNPKGKEYEITRYQTGTPGSTRSDFVETFSPEQVKSIYNDDPTTSDDIRNSSWNWTAFDDVPEDIKREVERKIERSKKDFGIKKRSNEALINDIETPDKVGKNKLVAKQVQRWKERAAEEVSDAVSTFLDFGMVSDYLQDEDKKTAFTRYKNSNDFARMQARVYITEHGGYTQAMKDLTEMFNYDKPRNLTFQLNAAEEIIAGFLNNGITAENVEELMEFMTLISIAETEWGRQGQMLKMIRKTPLGRAMYWEKVVKRMNNRFDFVANKPGNRIINKQQAKIEVPQEYYDAIRNATTPQEMDAAEEALTKYIGQHAPLTLANMFRNWRYFAMLSNPITHARNMMGNTGMLGLRMSKDAVAAGLESFAVNRGWMKQDERTHSVNMLVSTQSEAVKNTVKKMWSENASFIQSGGHEGFESVMRDAGRKSNVKWIDKAMSFNNNALETADRLFLYTTFVSAATQLINAQGIDVNNMTHAQKNAIVEYATQQAQEATYRDASKVADALNQLARIGNISRFLVESVMPFKKTPINIFKRGLEYSPAGLLKGVYDIAKSSKNKGSVPASKICDELAKGIVGSGLALLGFFLSKAGVLKRKAGNGERDEKFEKDIGHQDYSIELGDLSIKIEQMAPMTFPLFLGASIEELFRGEQDKFTLSDFAEAVLSIADPFMDMSFVAGINSALQTYDENKLSGVATNMITSFTGQHIPIIGSKINNFIMPRKTTTKADATSRFGGTLDSTFRSWWNNVPIVGPLTLEPYVTATGEYVDKDFGGYVLSFINNFASPVNISIVDSTPINEEIARLVATTGNVEFVPQSPKKYMQINNENVKMNAKEYTEFSKDHNETVYAALEDVMNSQRYQKATDEQKINMLKQAYDTAHTAVSKKYRQILINKMKEKEK